MLIKILGGLFVVLGIFIILKNEWVLENFGRVEWAEAKFSGGTRTFLKMLGLIFIFFGMLLILDLFGGIVYTIFTPGFVPGGR